MNHSNCSLILIFHRGPGDSKETIFLSITAILSIRYTALSGCVYVYGFFHYFLITLGISPALIAWSTSTMAVMASAATRAFGAVDTS